MIIVSGRGVGAFVADGASGVGWTVLRRVLASG
jgi:hypothetical protein